MNRKESAQSPTANGPGQFPAPPSGDESEPKGDPKPRSPRQESVSNRETQNADLSEGEPEDGESGDGLNQETGDGTND